MANASIRQLIHQLETAHTCMNSWSLSSLTFPDTSNVTVVILCKSRGIMNTFYSNVRVAFEITSFKMKSYRNTFKINQALQFAPLSADLRHQLLHVQYSSDCISDPVFRQNIISSNKNSYTKRLPKGTDDFIHSVQGLQGGKSKQLQSSAQNTG